MGAGYLVTTGLVLAAALPVMPARAADLNATSAIDTVTVFPDGAEKYLTEKFWTTED